MHTICEPLTVAMHDYIANFDALIVGVTYYILSFHEPRSNIIILLILAPVEN